MNDDSSTSRFLSLILRHRPEVIGITLDQHGWADVRELIEGISKSRPFSMEILERIAANDAKQRYSFNEDHTKIRANQGHSIPVDVELEQCEPPEVLYHERHVCLFIFLRIPRLPEPLVSAMESRWSFWCSPVKWPAAAFRFTVPATVSG